MGIDARQNLLLRSFQSLGGRCTFGRFAPLPSLNKGYTVRGSTRPSPKFFFRYASEKLRISLTLAEIASLAKSSALLRTSHFG